MTNIYAYVLVIGIGIYPTHIFNISTCNSNDRVVFGKKKSVIEIKKIIFYCYDDNKNLKTLILRLKVDELR